MPSCCGSTERALSDKVRWAVSGSNADSLLELRTGSERRSSAVSSCLLEQELTGALFRKRGHPGGPYVVLPGWKQVVDKTVKAAKSREMAFIGKAKILALVYVLVV